MIYLILSFIRSLGIKDGMPGTRYSDGNLVFSSGWRMYQDDKSEIFLTNSEKFTSNIKEFKTNSHVKKFVEFMDLEKLFINVNDDEKKEILGL